MSPLPEVRGMSANSALYFSSNPINFPDVTEFRLKRIRPSFTESLKSD